MPPTWKSVKLLSLPACLPMRRSLAGQRARQMLIQIGSALPATIRSGIALASAPKIALGTKWPTRWREATAAGGRQLRIDPSGAVTWTGRKAPSLWGTSGLIAAFMAKEA